MGAFFLLAILLYLVVTIIVIAKVKGWRAKSGVIVVAALIPTADILLAQTYMYYRCGQDGGMRVHETVVLKRSELLKTTWEGLNKNENYKREVILDNFPCKPNRECWLLPERYKVIDIREVTIFGIERGGGALIEKSTGKILGESVGYGHRTSWFIGIFFGPEAFDGWRCPTSNGARISIKDAIFTVLP